LSQLTSTDAFSEAAQQYSATDTRTRGGRMDWMPINQLPPTLRPIILGLSPGEVTAPIPLPEALALFQLRDVQETTPAAPSYAAIDFVAYQVPGGRSEAGLKEAARIIDNVDTCDDFYGIAKGQPPELLVRESLPPAKIPRDYAMELSKLDDGETSIAVTRNNGQTLVLLMLCGRTAALNEDASREQVASALTQQRLATFAASYLDQLRADAVIVNE
jgi:peptidyl-prolyl cis-trans isomerase SurA